MSRSFRKTPIFGNTLAASEKKDKKIAHHAERAAVRKTMANATAEDDVVLSEKRQAYSDVWGFAKDGRKFVHLHAKRLGDALKLINPPKWIKSDRQAHKALAK